MGAGEYRFTMTATIADVRGNALDGNNDGAGGDALVRTFSIDPPSGLYEGRGNRARAAAVPLALVEDPAGSGLFHTEIFGIGSLDPGDNDYDWWSFWVRRAIAWRFGPTA